MEPAEAQALELDLPAMKTAGDVQEAMVKVVAAVQEGRITSAEASRVGGLIDLARRAIETRELADRIQALEERVKR